MKRFGLLAGLALMILSGSFIESEAAEPLARPEGNVILSITGSISTTNAEGRADFDRQMLEALEWQTVSSYTRWTDGVQSFEGVPLSAVLRRVGASGEKVIASALNDYKVEIPLADAEAYSVLLAMKQNGEWMRVRDKGPIWIIYPYDNVDRILDVHANRMVWQLRSLGIE